MNKSKKLKIMVEFPAVDVLQDMANVMVEMSQYIPKDKVDYFNNKVMGIVEDIKNAKL